MTDTMYTAPKKTPLKNSVDWSLVISYLLLVIFGWMNIYSSVHSGEGLAVFDFASRSGKQLVWILTAFGIALAILFLIKSPLWEVISTPAYLVVFALLVAVIFLGQDIKGSRSWFTLGPVSFQPAELSKITTSLVLASVMGRHGFKLRKFGDFATVAAIVGLPMLAILAESETGSALVYLGFLFVLYREGLSGWVLYLGAMAVLLFIFTLRFSPYVSLLTLLVSVSLVYCVCDGKFKRWLYTDLPVLGFMAVLPRLMSWATGKWEFLSSLKPIYLLALLPIGAFPWYVVRAYRNRRPTLWLALAGLLVGAALIVSTDFLFDDVLQDHQRKRIEVLLGMKEDPAGVGYNVNQSMIAIGAGGLTGKGYLNGTQTTYGFVPEQSTDFIFCTVGEEWGFVGCFALIALYVFLISRIIIDAERSRSAYARIYGYCVASIIFMHLFINVGMTVGMMPVIGIPLPLISYGGSSLWSFTILIFIFVALDREEKKYF